MSDLLPDIDGRFLGETLTPRRWDGSRLLGVALNPANAEFDMNYFSLFNVGLLAMMGNIDMGGCGIQSCEGIGLSGDLIFTTNYAQAYPWTTGTVKIGRATNSFLALCLGQTASLPTAESGLRGEVRVVKGGSDVADKVYACLRSAAGLYSWVQVASG